MRTYAQTNIQLFNQLRREGYSDPDLSLVRVAYEHAIALFTGRFQPSGKSFIAHVVGTASILASVRLPAPVVATGLLHNVYQQGDFGYGREGISKAKRRKIQRILGPEAEAYLAAFSTISWRQPTVRLALEAPDKLSPVERVALLLLSADHLEHLLDLDVLYYAESTYQSYVEGSKTAAGVVSSLGFGQLAAELGEAIRRTQSAELPIGATEPLNGSFVIVPNSCRKRASVALWQLSVQVITGFHRFIRRTIRTFAPNRATAWVKERSLRYFPLRSKSETFRRLFPKPARLERVATGFQFAEGPVWIAEEKSLLFSDIPADRIVKLPPDGRAVSMREPSGKSNGLTRDKTGRLISCEHSNRRVTRTEIDGSLTILVGEFNGKKLNSPNDVVVKSDGAIYFTDPAYGIRPEQQEQECEGVYRISPDGKAISLVAADFDRPNGLAFSPDERKLYIDDSRRRHIRVFDVNDDGSLSNGRVFHDMNVAIRGAPDGMKVDIEGRVYCTGAGGVWVFDPDGHHLGTIVTPEKSSNCAWGGGDWRSLYITAVSSVYKIRVNTRGIKVP